MSPRSGEASEKSKFLSFAGNLNPVPRSSIRNLVTKPTDCTICLHLAVLSSWNAQDGENFWDHVYFLFVQCSA
jgi:hypothetical protein